MSSDPLQPMERLELLSKLKPISQYNCCPHRTLGNSRLFAEIKLYQFNPPNFLRQGAKVFEKTREGQESLCPGRKQRPGWGLI